MPIDFEGTNVDLVKPPDMTDEECISLRCQRWQDSKGVWHWLIAFKPSYEDMEALKRGEPIFAHFLAPSFPVVGFFTKDENGNINE